MDHRGYYVSDSYGKVEKLANRGKEQVVDLVGGMAERLMEDMRENFAMQLYVDGYATGNEKFICGLEIAFGNGGAATNGFVGTPSDTYAGLSTRPCRTRAGRGAPRAGRRRGRSAAGPASTTTSRR
jgi:hypothetical protein